jgi:hypothetical protein
LVVPSLWALFPLPLFFNEVITLVIYLFRSCLKRWHFWLIFGWGRGGISLEYLSELRRSWEVIQSLQANAEISQRNLPSSACKRSFVIAESYTKSAGKLVTHCLQTKIIIIIIILNERCFYALLLHILRKPWNVYIHQTERHPKKKFKRNCYGKSM